MRSVGAVGDYDDDLPGLRYHWDSAYLISHPEPDVWIAQRRDTRETLRAESASVLLDLIRADYAERPVPRDLPGRPRGTRGPGSRFTCEG